MRLMTINILVITLLSIASLTILAVKFDPFVADTIIKSLFFGTLFLSIWGLVSLSFIWGSGGELIRKMRRSFFISISIIYLLLITKLRFDRVYLPVLPLLLLTGEILISRRNKQKDLIQDFS